MSATQSEIPSPASTESEDQSYALDSIGIELEYPIAADADMVPGGDAQSSGSVRSHFGRGADWLTEEFPDEGGYVGSDHTGAEITTGILDLHSTQPEDWYEASIERCEEAGYPFAACGYGDTNFGLHFHISDINEEQRQFLRDVCGEEWGQVFFTASVNENSLDPWRNGGIRNPRNPLTRAERQPTQHYEFRLPEPMQQEHFSLVMDFMRMVSAGLFDEAEEFARDLVYSKDERLTPVAQYQQLAEVYEDWPQRHPDESRDPFSGNRTRTSMAEWFHDLMESNG